MRRSNSEQFGRPAVIVEPDDTDADAVISFANSIGARYHDGEDNCLVLDFQVDDRRVGPEVYTEGALRRTIESATRNA